MRQPHIQCSVGDIAPIVLTPGDPARVRLIAQYWDEVSEVANNRDFLTMTGKYNGVPISATSTGVGSPSAAIAVEELANIGAKVIIRIGTCGALQEGVQPGDTIVPYAAIRAEGTTREYLPPEFPSVADPGVYQVLWQSASGAPGKSWTGVNRTHDAFYEPLQNLVRWGELFQDQRLSGSPLPLVSSEMECSTVFLVAMLRGVRAGCILSVNTTEPLRTLTDNPSAMYALADDVQAKEGIDRAIRIALSACEQVTSSLTL